MKIGGDVFYLEDIEPWKTGRQGTVLCLSVAVSYDAGIYTTYNLKGNGNTSMQLPLEYAHNYICGYYLG